VALFQAADVLLAKPGPLGKLLLRHALALPNINDIAANEAAHVHARTSPQLLNFVYQL
jgi:hypothetical protein